MDGLKEGESAVGALVASPWTLQRSLARTLLVPVSLAVLIVAVCMGMAIWSVSSTHRLEQARAEARTVARAVQRAGVSNSAVGLQGFVADFARGEEVHLIVVVDGDPSRVVASTHEPWIGRALEELPEHIVAEDLRKVLATREEATTVHGPEHELDCTAPFGTEGAVMVHIDTALAESAATASMWQFGGIAFAGLLAVGVAGLYFFHTRVSARLAVLARSVTHPTQHRDGLEASTASLESGRGDEISILAAVIQSARERERQDLSRIERLAMVARCTTNAVVTADASRRVEWVNARCASAMGRSIAEFRGSPILDAVQGGTGANPAASQFRGALARGDSCRVQLSTRAGEGLRHRFDTELQPLRSAEGEITGFVCIQSDLTDIMASREALAASERGLQLVVAGADLGTWDWDLQTGAVVVNERCCRMLGYEPNALEPHVRAWDDLLYAPDRAAREEALHAHFDGRTEHYHFEHRLRHKNGSLVWVLGAGRVYERDAQGKPSKIAGVHLDITARRRAEERFELCVDAINVGVWDWDLRTDHLFFSARLRTMLRYPPNAVGDELLSQARIFEECVLPEDAAWVRAALDAHLERGVPYSIDLRLRSRSGEIRWYYSAGKCSRDEQGVPLRMAGSVEDIHDARLAEEARVRLASIVESSEDAIFFLGLDGRPVTWNRGAERMLGKTSAEFGAMLESDTIPEPHRVHELAAFAEVLAGGRLNAYMSERVRGNGTVLEVSVALSPVLDASGRVIGASKIIRDITDRKEKQQLAALNGQLSRQNHTLEEMTERAHRFVDDVSHEFRTPLTVIREYAGIIADGLGGAVTPQQKEWLQVVDVASLDLNQMVEDFLDSSKLRVGRLRVDRRACTAQSLVAGVRQMLVRKASARGIKLIEAIDPDLPRVYADAEKVRRILMNLATNAIKFSPDRSAIVLGVHATAMGDVEFTVTDQGQGLTEGDLSALFERFRQLPSVLAPGVKGFGLGLNIARQLVWLNLGSIRVESELRKGSTFAFTLPSEDRRVILDRFFERLAEREDPPTEVAVLRIARPADPIGREQQRRLLVATTRPSDIMLESTDQTALVLIGPTQSSETWRMRLLEGLSAGDSASMGLEVTIIGNWSYPEGIDAARVAFESCGTLEVTHAV